MHTFLQQCTTPKYVGERMIYSDGDKQYSSRTLLAKYNDSWYRTPTVVPN